MSTEVATRGRPRTFDEDQVLDQITALFWERGFEAASMNEIVESAGLNKSSLYNAFGSKDELFRRVVDRYLDMRIGMLREFTQGDRGIDDLLQVVEFIRAESTDEQGGRGCLGINTSAELGNQEDWVAGMSNRYRSGVSEAFGSVIDRAVQLGEIPADMAPVYTQTMLSLAMAIALTARSGASRAEIDAQVDSAAELVASWRT